MIKKIALLLLFLLFGLAGTSCSKEEVESLGERTLYPVSSYEETLEITMGDVMPFYDDGIMNIYLLAVLGRATL